MRLAVTEAGPKGELAGELIVGEEAAPLRVVVNRRARRLIIKVDPTRREIIVTAPSKRAVADALNFAVSRQGWIERQWRDMPPFVAFAPDARIPFRGAPCLLRHAPDARAPVALEDGDPAIARVGGDERFFARRVEDWLKREARAAIASRVDQYCAQIDARRSSISLRDSRTRWGSCAENGRMSFSWRLILCPPFILDYVAAHETAHLRHMDHSRKFWKLLEGMYGDVEEAKVWLDANGAQLHAYGAKV